MPKLKPDKVEKKYFSIGEVARMTDVNLSAIRFYEDNLFLQVSKRNKQGERFFTGDELKTMIWVIKCAKVYKLETVRAALNCLPKARILSGEFLNDEETQQIIKYLNDGHYKISTLRRQNSHPPGPTG